MTELTGINLGIEKGSHNEVEIAPQRLAEIFSSNKFTNALYIASRPVIEEGVEVGFDVDITGSGKDVIGSVFKSQTSSYDSSDRDVLRVLENSTGERKGQLLDLHFHPNDFGALAPSRDDLMHFYSPSENDLPGDVSFNMMGIGQVTKSGDIRVMLLTLQKGKKAVSVSDQILYEEEISLNSSQNSTETVLREIGLQVVVLDYKKRGKSFQLSPDSKARLQEVQTFRIATS